MAAAKAGERPFRLAISRSEPAVSFDSVSFGDRLARPAQHRGRVHHDMIGRQRDERGVGRAPRWECKPRSAADPDRASPGSWPG